jgi:hypothetical protein
VHRKWNELRNRKGQSSPSEPMRHQSKTKRTDL